jgi:hypothetical protein
VLREAPKSAHLGCRSAREAPADRPSLAIDRPSTANFVYHPILRGVTRAKCKAWRILTWQQSPDGRYGAVTTRRVSLEIRDGKLLDGSLRYVSSDYALDFTPRSPIQLDDRLGPNGVASLCVGTLQIAVAADTGFLLYVWGYFPMGLWSHGTVEEPEFDEGFAFAEIGERMSDGMAYRICEFQDPAATYDSSNGWLRVGTNEDCKPETLILIANDTGIGVTQSGVLSSIFLRPALSIPEQGELDLTGDMGSSELNSGAAEQATRVGGDQANNYGVVKASWEKFGFRLRLFIIGFALLMILIGNTPVGALIAIPLVLIAVVLLLLWLLKSGKYLRLEFKERRKSHDE